MKGFIQNLKQLAEANTNFRQVLYTAKSSQLVLMSLLPQEEIGEETHHLDQFLYIISGAGQVIINDQVSEIAAGSGIVIPAGSKHNVINNSAETTMKLFTVYSPPEHKDGTIHSVKPSSEDPEEHFDGQTTE